MYPQYMATPNKGALKLRRYLKKLKGTSADFAAKCEMMPAQLCHLANGRRIPTLPQAVLLERYAKIPCKAWLQVTKSKQQKSNAVK